MRILKILAYIHRECKGATIAKSVTGRRELCQQVIGHTRKYLRSLAMMAALFQLHLCPKCLPLDYPKVVHAQCNIQNACSVRILETAFKP
jgi:hypothetical protein